MSQIFFRQTVTYEEFQTPLSLYELHQQIRDELEVAFPENYWVVAEVAQISPDRRKGHCYLTLVDKGEDARQMLAQARATIWSARFQTLGRHFEERTGQPLKAGLKILFQAQVRFHELYGLSLDIVNIDPNYTIGDLARQRQETLKRLEGEGLLEANKALDLALVPQRLAIVSSATAAGYQDFVHQLKGNSFGYTFSTTLFPATVQGNEAPASIKRAMALVAKYQERFDAIVLIRGGGSQTDLSCFDDYTVAAAIGHSPLPVLTGIGHERDESIADIVAHTRLKTPTAVANFLIDRFRETEEHTEGLLDSIRMFAAQQMKLTGDKLERLSLRFTNQTKELLQTNKDKLEQLSRGLLLKPRSYLEAQKHQVSDLEKDISANTKDLLHTRKSHLQELSVCVEGKSQRYLHMKEHELNHLVHCLETEANGKLKQEQLSFTKYSDKVGYCVQQKVQNEKHRLRLLEMSIEANNPEKLLLRGYTLTLVNGKIIKSTKGIKDGDVIVTKMQDGTLHSKVVTINHHDK
ncbi:exodeoxyribonuclease VII large subunit [Pontibacter ummariensis]|uniref:Exodeoxyribonuclease 7 large subunit n=1 Tax=Pontibacter ummariensis TaxID=1610492 RepID=A0A239ILW4_9BACT|nr:exodeoxyribonuclease VII large subunit [Pontibacter ummariensis]PRY09736.1 exodeoxyribonuclease VII large subunit [Pontibacter ummariensis]SNS94756.1 Exodeoxyribonuclease VII large subunit [Pontibacter ummariensis]